MEKEQKHELSYEQLVRLMRKLKAQAYTLTLYSSQDKPWILEEDGIMDMNQKTSDLIRALRVRQIEEIVYPLGKEANAALNQLGCTIAMQVYKALALRDNTKSIDVTEPILKTLAELPQELQACIIAGYLPIDSVNGRPAEFTWRDEELLGEIQEFLKETDETDVDTRYALIKEHMMRKLVLSENESVLEPYEEYWQLTNSKEKLQISIQELFNGYIKHQFKDPSNRQNLKSEIQKFLHGFHPQMLGGQAKDMDKNKVIDIITEVICGDVTKYLVNERHLVTKVSEEWNRDDWKRAYGSHYVDKNLVDGLIKAGTLKSIKDKVSVRDLLRETQLFPRCVKVQANKTNLQVTLVSSVDPELLLAKPILDCKLKITKLGHQAQKEKKAVNFDNKNSKKQNQTLPKRDKPKKGEVKGKANQ